MKKMKNPLYVVKEKGKVVEEASNILDALVKKFNLEPVLAIISQIFKMLLEQVNDYPTLLAVKKFIDLILSKLQLFNRFGIA